MIYYRERNGKFRNMRNIIYSIYYTAYQRDVFFDTRITRSVINVKNEWAILVF